MLVSFYLNVGVKVYDIIILVFNVCVDKLSSVISGLVLHYYNSSVWKLLYKITIYDYIMILVL